MFPKVIIIGKHNANYDLLYKTLSDALGRSVTSTIDSAGKVAHSETSYLLAIANATADMRPASDILQDCSVLTRHLFYSFLVLHTRSLLPDFNGYTDLDVTEIITKNRLYLYLVSGRLRDYRHTLLERHECEDDFQDILNQFRSLFKEEGFWHLVQEQKVKGIPRLL